MAEGGVAMLSGEPPASTSGFTFTLSGDVLFKLDDGTEMCCKADEAVVVVGGKVARLARTPVIQARSAVEIAGDNLCLGLHGVPELRVKGNNTRVKFHDDSYPTVYLDGVKMQ